MVDVIEPGTIVNAVDGDGESASYELVEQRVASIAAIGDAGKGGVLAFDAEAGVAHDQHEKARFALGEAVIDDRLDAFSGGRSSISSASPP